MKNNNWIFRFMGKVPSGRFEYTCGICGNYQILEIPRETEIYNADNPSTFDCECGVTILVWQQTTHWHLKIVRRLKDAKSEMEVI